MRLYPAVAPQKWPCNYPGLKKKPPRKCPDCSLGYWAQGAAWLHFLRTKRAPTTVSGYRSSLRAVARELEGLGYKAERELRADKIIYALAQMSAHTEPSRFNVARMALKGYLEWRNDPNARKPLDISRVFRDIEKRPTPNGPQDFDPKEVWRRLRAIDTRQLDNGFPLALRDVAFMALLFGTGIHPGEAARLKPSVIDFQRKRIDLPQFKRADPRPIPVIASVLPVIRRWADDKRAKKSKRYKPTPLLFHGPEGGAVSRNDWKAMVGRYGLRTGWRSGHGKAFTLRNLRPTFGSWMLNAPGGDLGKVQKQLGHKSPETTARYYARYDIRQLDAVVSKMRI